MVDHVDDLILATEHASVRCDPQSGTFELRLAGHRIDRCSLAICLADDVRVLSSVGRFVGAERTTLTDSAGSWRRLQTTWRLGSSLTCKYIVDALGNAPMLRAQLELTNDGPADLRVNSLRPLVVLTPDSLLA